MEKRNNKRKYKQSKKSCGKLCSAVELWQKFCLNDKVFDSYKLSEIFKSSYSTLVKKLESTYTATISDLMGRTELRKKARN